MMQWPGFAMRLGASSLISAKNNGFKHKAEILLDNNGWRAIASYLREKSDWVFGNFNWNQIQTMKTKRNSLVLKLLCLVVLGNIAVFAQTNPAGEPYLQGIKEQVSLPPEVVSFIAFKEQQAKDIATQYGFELTPAMKDYFAAATAGRLQEIKATQPAFFSSVMDTNNPASKTPLTQVAVDMTCAMGTLFRGDPDLVMALGHDLMDSLPANCIYFGGTDPGRGLPTMLCKTPGDPVFVLSQNPLADSRYWQYVREMYGTRIQLPATNEVQEITEACSADTQRRWQQDQDFPNEPKQLRPGESVRMVDGKPRLEGAVSIMGNLNARLAKAIFDKNPDREFYVEQSWPFDWMYPCLSPHGPILKLNRQPLAAIPAADLTADAAYWSAKVTQLKSNPKFSGDDSVGKAYAHLRSCIAGLYGWRAQSAKDGGERQSMFSAAESAYNQALALYPAAPEAVTGLVNLFLTQNRLDDALTVAKKALAADPSNGQLKTLFGQLQKFEQQKAASTDPTTNPNPQQQLKQLKDDFDHGKIDKATYEQKKSAILNSL